MLESADLLKDQTLFLSQIHQSALQRTMFPIGQYKKSYVKQLAREAGLDHILQKREVDAILSFLFSDLLPRYFNVRGR